MKDILYVFFILSFILFVNDQYAQNTNQDYRTVKKKINKLERDSTEMEYFNPEPEILYKPAIVIPDSLLPLKKPIKMTIRVEINSAGKPLNPIIIKSTNKRFNSFAIKLVLEYKFRPLKEAVKRKRIFVNIPLVFRKTK